MAESLVGVAYRYVRSEARYGEWLVFLRSHYRFAFWYVGAGRTHIAREDAETALCGEAVGEERRQGLYVNCLNCARRAEQLVAPYTPENPPLTVRVVEGEPGRRFPT